MSKVDSEHNFGIPKQNESDNRSSSPDSWGVVGFADNPLRRAFFFCVLVWSALKCVCIYIYILSDFWGLFPMESGSSHPQSRVLKILIRFPLKECLSRHNRMTAFMRHRGFRFVALLHAALHAVTNAFCILRHGGGRQSSPPPIAIAVIKTATFFP